MPEKDAGEVIRKWLTERLGNPVMTSKKKQEIAEIEKDEAVRNLQERGEDYPAEVHKERKN